MFRLKCDLLTKVILLVSCKNDFPKCSQTDGKNNFYWVSTKTFANILQATDALVRAQFGWFSLPSKQIPVSSQYDIVLVSLLLTFNIIHNFFCGFYCWLWVQLNYFNAIILQVNKKMFLILTIAIVD